MKTVKCMVAGYNANGDPDFYFCKVRASDRQIGQGDHMARAKWAAVTAGYIGQAVVFDEFDDAGEALSALFRWETASEFIVGS